MNNRGSDFHYGVVAIVGRPNSGKSTLLNRILDEKVAIVSRVPQTTRYKIRGIYTDQRGQIVFIDTPGMHLPRHQMGKYMLRQIDQALENSNLIIHLVDTTKRLGQEEQLVIDKIKNSKVPIILGLNKIDINPKFLDDYIKAWEEVKGKKVTDLSDSLKLLPLSALSGTNLDKLIEVIFAALPPGEMLYPKDMLTDLPQRLALADIIREKLFESLRKELPHSLAVYIEEIEPRSNKLIYIRAIILIERDSQKSIIIGKRGELLKEVGSRSRAEIENLLEKKVFLETFVKVKSNWRQDPQTLKQLGYI